MDTHEEINQVLAQMGEPPLGGRDVVQTSPPEHADVAAATAELNGERKIERIEPPGFKRCSLIFANGREVFLDMQLDELVAAVRAFNAARRSRPWWAFWRAGWSADKDFLQLPYIQLVGGDQQGNGGVCVQTPIHFSHRAIELLQSMGELWLKRVPGQVSSNGKVAVVSGGDAKNVILEMNRRQKRDARRNGRG